MSGFRSGPPFTTTLEVLSTEALRSRLKSAMSVTEDVYVNAGVDEAKYLADLAADIQRNLCEPFPVSARVAEPGFPEAPVGQEISGICLACREGYWLVYQPEPDRFLCFWGADKKNLSAPGIYGSPLYCWSA